jgi:hypothetical protein
MRKGLPVLTIKGNGSNAHFSRKLSVTCLCVLIAVSCLLGIEQVHAWTGYAGYRLYGEETYAGEGTRAQIYAINPWKPPMQQFREYVTVVLSYYNGYWLQFGYSRGIPGDEYYLRYYYEIVDTYPICRWYYDYDRGPSPGSSHVYYMVHPYGYGEESYPEWWLLYVDDTHMYSVSVEPYIAVDLHAPAESTDGAIVFNGTHFSGLKHFVDYRQYWRWMLWPEHEAIVTSPPYSIVEVSDYEFYANGGG